MLMLVFSSGVILYGSLFRSREIAFLLTIPARTGRVFLHKFHEAIVLSSWGFVLLGSPMLLAYGIVAERAVVLLRCCCRRFIVAFIYIPVAIGAIFCMLVVRCVPDHRHGRADRPAAVLLAGGGVDGVERAGRSEEQPAYPGLVPGDPRPDADLGSTPVAELVAEHRSARRPPSGSGPRACCS